MVHVRNVSPPTLKGGIDFIKSSVEPGTPRELRFIPLLLLNWVLKPDSLARTAHQATQAQCPLSCESPSLIKAEGQMILLQPWILLLLLG